MANVFNDQARERFTRSLAFMSKAETLLNDDVIYRSALADAVSAIKNMLQGYLLLKIATTPASVVTQRWQEIAASNRMPDLIQATIEAGLDLRGLASDIKRLNNERNFRAHDDPDRHIAPEQAQRALDLAFAVQRNIRKAVQGTPEMVDQRQGAVNRIASVARAAVSGQLARSAPPAQSSRQENAAIAHDASAAQAESTDQRDVHTGQSTAQATVSDQVPVDQTPTPETSESTTSDVDGTVSPTDDISDTQASEPAQAVAEDDDASTDTDELPAIGERPRKHRVRRVFRRALIAALLLILGALVGATVTAPLVAGGVPAWFPMPLSLAHTRPDLPSATMTPVSPSPTPVAVTGTTLFSGNLAAGPVVCSEGVATLTLRNLGATSLPWSAASPDAPGARFTVGSSSGQGAPVVQGVLPVGGSVTLDIHAVPSQYHIVVVGREGAIMLTGGTC